MFDEMNGSLIKREYLNNTLWNGWVRTSSGWHSEPWIWIFLIFSPLSSAALVYTFIPSHMSPGASAFCYLHHIKILSPDLWPHLVTEALLSQLYTAQISALNFPSTQSCWSWTPLEKAPSDMGGVFPHQIYLPLTARFLSDAWQFMRHHCLSDSIWV